MSEGPLHLACVDGAIVALEEARIPVSDDGLLRGDGVFEVIRVYRGRPFAAAAHFERLADSARNLRLPLDVAAIAGDAERLLQSAGPVDCALRVLATRGGHRIALLEELPSSLTSMSLGVQTYAPTRVLDGVKSLSYAANMLCARLARERGFDEALMVTPHGRVLESTTASFFWVRDGQLLTPPLSDHLLDSITRRVLLTAPDAGEQPTTLEDLRGAEEAFIASTVREVVGVHRIEDVELPAPGPRTNAAAALLRARIDQELAGSASAIPAS